MLPYKTITKNPSNYDPAELINIERYFCFDNTTECSAQASLNNCDHNIEYDNEILTYHQINIDSEEHDEDVLLANKECKVMVASEGIPECTIFNSWTDVETFFEEYGRRNGFIVIKYRVDKNKAGVVHKRTFTCEFGGKYKPNKNQQEKQRITKTKKVNCPWYINLSYGKAGTLISITTFVNEHNHNINFDTQEFGNKYRTLTEDALREVEIMTKYGCLSITTQRNLLRGHFSDLHFHDSDLNNAIQKFKRKETCRNSLCKPLFQKRWNNMLNKYPMAKDYLLRVLHPSSQFWARAYLSKIFTARIESTARVESYNWVIKREIKSNCTLTELADRLDQRLKAETQWNRFRLYKDSTTFPTVSTPADALFPAVTKNINKYLTDTINNRIKDEIAESLFLTANQIVPTSYELNSEQEIDEKTSLNTCNGDTQNNKKGNDNAVNKNQAMSEEDQAISEREDQAISEEDNQAISEENQAISEEKNEAILEGKNDNNSTDNE
ncbi:31882_t:CDS:2, partial [Racocetra persica]